MSLTFRSNRLRDASSNSVSRQLTTADYGVRAAVPTGTAHGNFNLKGSNTALQPPYRSGGVPCRLQC